VPLPTHTHTHTHPIHIQQTSKFKVPLSGKPPAFVNWTYKMKMMLLTALYIDKRNQVNAQTQSTTTNQVGRTMYNWTLSFFLEQNSQLISWLRFQKYLDTRGFYPQGDSPWNWNYTRYLRILSHAFIVIVHVIFMNSISLAQSTDFLCACGGFDRVVMQSCRNI